MNEFVQYCVPYFCFFCLCRCSAGESSAGKSHRPQRHWTRPVCKTGSHGCSWSLFSVQVGSVCRRLLSLSLERRFSHMDGHVWCDFSEEKAKLLRDVMAKIDTKNETLEWVHEFVSLLLDRISQRLLVCGVGPVFLVCPKQTLKVAYWN